MPFARVLAADLIESMAVKLRSCAGAERALTLTVDVKVKSKGSAEKKRESERLVSEASEHCERAS